MKTRSSAAFGLLLCVSCGGKAHEAAVDAVAGAANIADASVAGAGTGATSPSAGTGNVPDASAPDAAPDANAGTCGSTRVPKEHRAVTQACPKARGSLGPLDTSSCTDRVGITCTSDADCTTGDNGRCVLNGNVCETVCSYDQCLTDTDCAAGPCICRSSGTEVAPNGCLPGSNCRTDADCGCDYCSPSITPSTWNCGPGNITYSCHTANDDCIDQSECSAPSSCGYDATAGHWLCGVCVAPPHPR